MQDPQRRQKFYDATSQYVDIGDSQKFNSFVGDYFGDQEAPQRVDVSDVEQAEQPQIPTVTMEQVDAQQQTPYGDLTTENFLAAKQRREELLRKKDELESRASGDARALGFASLFVKDKDRKKEYDDVVSELNNINGFINEWNKTEDAKAYYDEQKRVVDDVSARVDQMQSDRNKERLNKKREEEDKKSFWLRFAEGLAAAENPITAEVVDAVTDPVNNDLRTARNEVRNAKNQLQLEEMRMNGEKQGLGIVRGLETANYYELMPAVGMADAMSLLQLSQDIKNGKELTDSQKLLKEAMEARAGVDFAYQDNNTLWERIGQSTPEQLMFTLQFVVGAGVTGATKVGEKVAAKSAEKAAKRLAKKEATSAARNFVATRVVPELEGMAVSSAIQTFANPLSVAGMVEDFEKRYAGDIYYDKDGNLHVFDNDRSAGQAAYQAIASAWIENFTEYAGGNITKSAKLLDSKMFDLAGKFDNVMKTVGAGKIQDVFKIPQQLGRLTQIGSAPEEFLEEELGSVMNALMMTDAQRGESYGEAFKNTTSSAFAGEQQLETFLSCAITSMLLGGGGNAVNGVRNAGLRKSVNQDVEQSKALLGKVRGINIEELDAEINNGEIKDIASYLEAKSNENGWSKDEQGAAVSYVLNRTRQIGVKHNDDTAIEAEQAEYRKQADEMVNRWDGQNIYNVTYTDKNGEEQIGTIVNGRVHYTTNEDGTYSFNPYMSSGMLAIRKADGTVEQVAGRSVNALNNVSTIEEQLESQNQTIDQMMRSAFEQDGMLPTIESVWGGNLVPNVTQFQNGRYTYLGQDDNGLYAFANNDKKTSKANPIIYLTERQLVEYGLSLNLENAKATGDAEAAQKAQDDLDYLKRLDEITADAGAKGQWDVLKAYAQQKVQMDASGQIIPDGSNEQATAAYLLAISEGSFENAIASVDQTIAALGTPQQTEVTDNAADNAAMNNAAATVDADKARQIDFYTNVRNRLTEMQQGKEEADQEEAEQVVANTPVSQMEVGQQFPVEWHGQQAMATVMGKDADGRSVVTVRDMNGDDIEAGIDDMSDAEWEGVRVQPQEATAPEQATNNPKTLDDITDEDIPKREDGTVIYYEINDPMVYAKAALMEEGSVESALRMIDEDIIGLQRDIKDSRYRERGEARLKLMEEVKRILLSLQQQPISQEETQPQVETPQPTPELQPEPTPTPEPQPQEPQLPRDKDGNIDYEQISDPALYAQGLVEEFGEEAIDTINELIAEENENYTMAIEKKNAIERRRAQKESQGKLDFYYKVKDALAPQEQVETPTEEAAPIEETPVAETPVAEVPTEETSVEETQPEQAPEQVEGTPQEPVEQQKEEKKPEKKDTEFQKRIAAVGEPKTLEEAILMDIALGGAKFRWGNRDEDKRVLKRGIGDLWKYSQQEFKKRIGIMKKDGYSIETYAEAILEGRLMDYSGVVSQIAENMDMRDIVDAIEDVLQMVRTKTEALEALESKRREESEEEQRYIRSLQDQEARDMGFDGWEDYEAYQQSLEENNLTDADYEEINRIFAEQTQEEDEQRARSSESEGDTAANQSDEQQGVRGENEGGTGVLQGTQATDTGAVEPTGQGTRSESGDTANASSQGEGASEVRAEIERLQAQRENIIRQRDEIQQRYEQANGLFGDTQAEESDLFGGQNFLSPELAQATIDGYNRQIKQIDEQIAKLEASLKRAEGVTQTEIEEAAEVAPEDIEVASANPADTETKVEKGLTEEEVDAAEGIDTQTKLLAKEYIKGNKNELTKDAYEEVREYYAERGRRNPEQDSRTASGTQLAFADNETADQRGGGQRGVEPGRVDRGGGEETLSEDGRRGEDGTQQPSATAGEQSVGSGNGEQLGSVGQLVDSGDTTRSGRSGGNGSNVRQPRGEKEGDRVSGTGTRGQSGTSQRRSSDEIDKDIADDLAEISGLFAKEMPLSQDERTKTRNREVELPQPMNNESEPAEEPQAIDPKWFRNVRKAIFKLAGHVFEKGYNQFDEWKNKIKDLLHSAVKNFREKLSDERLDQLLADAWECPFEYNGEVKTIREWASELHAAEVRKMLSKSIEEKRKEQEEANKKHIKQVHGDLENIKATLPFLLPHQQENVAKAERQFFSEEHADREHGYGKGYCFTDGTGTGKTFTGLGIARRFVNEGKGRILILTTKTKVNDWVADGAKMGLDVTSLEAGAKKAGKTPTEFKGSGIVCTTYANARQNKALLEDVFDLVIYDESHYIMNNKGGEETISTKSHYMLTNKNIENALARLQEIHPLWIREQELVEERQQQEAIISNDESSYAAQQAAVARISQIDGQLKQIKEQQKDELPAMREKAAEAAKVTKAVFLSATPFKSIDNLEYAEGYLFSYPEEDALTKGSTDHRSGKDEFKLRFFGSMYRWRHHQIEEHVQNLDAAVQQQQAFADRLMNTLGTMSGVVLDNGYDYSRHFPLVEVAMADQFNSAVEAINRDPALRVLGEYFPFDDYQKMSVLFETMKVAAMLPRIKEHLAKGRKVVIFNRRTNYPQPTPAHPNPWVPQNPFVEGLATAIATAKQSDEKKAEAIMNAVNVFQERYGSLIAWADKLDYRLPAEQLKDAFGDKIEIINGKVTGKKRQAIIDKFNRDDDQGLDLLLGQEITMREGISIHDTTGNKQRVVMSLALPQETTTFIQGEGRIYRIGNKSNAIFEYPLLGINRELQLFALSFNAAVGVTENLAMGSSARNLARSIAKGVMEDSGVVPMENQGIGGREKDYGKSTRDAYSSAINDYYSNQKQKAGRENRLGEDYYATPEPLGFKMVQWLNLAEGEEVLEPSAGHGAIARYFPNNVRSLAIEPSDALFTMLALNTGGVDKDNAAQASGKNKFVQNGTFEDLKTINKYDAIAMNPPFGHAGATAIEHLEKAWQHLRNSGRIAIIVPTGAMDKKMEKWFDEHKNAVVVGEIKLPSVTFQQAGTSVSTRMLLIDRVDRASFRQKVAAKRVSLDMTRVQNIDEFFRELRDVDMPSRMIDPATKLLRHGDVLRTKLSGNDIVDYKRNPQTDRRSKNMGKDMTVGEEGVSMYLSNKAKGMNYDFYYSQRASWNDIKKLRGRGFFNKYGYVYLSDLANCETLAEAKDKRLMDKWNSTQENFEQAKEFAEAMTDFIRRVTGFTDEQIRDYAAGKVDLFDYTKIKDNAQLTFQDLTRRYEDMEQDPMLQALFEQVSTIAERIGMKIETFNDPYTTVMGSYNPLTNTLRINSGRWNNPSESDSAKSQTILHELIHSVTSYALNAYDKGLPMSDGLKEACRRTYEIFENIKGDYASYYGNSQVFAPSDAPKEAKYGFANTHEMLAEMANPTFRKYMQKKGLWTKLVDGIKRILNYLGLQNLGVRFKNDMSNEQYRRWYGTDKENVEAATNAGWVATNAFDELSETLDMFLDNFDAALYERRNDGIIRSNIVDREGTKEEGIEYSIRELPAPKKTGIGYKVFVLKDGQLYPPMVANPNGASTPVGYWLDADAAPVVGESKTGRSQVKAGGKGTQGGSGQLAYRPGWHLGEIPYALQFNRKDENGEKTLFPKDFVWAEVEYADDVDYQDEAESYGVTENGKYRHSYAGLPRVPVDGSYRYRTNPNPETDPWIITGAMRVNRILTPSEVDAMVREAGREPQQRQEGAVTDEQVNALNEALGLNDELYREQQEWQSGTELEITKDENGYRVDGLNDSYQNVTMLLDAWRDAHPDYIAEIRNGKLYVEKWEMPEAKTAKERRRRKASAERGWRRAHAFANDTIEKLGLQDNVIILDSTRGLKGKQKTAKGWFDPNTGKIVIVMPNHVDSQDVVKTILHEGVAHYGLRKLVGDENMNEFLDKVFEGASRDVRDRIIDLAMNKYNRNVRKATEEYLAGLAEDTNFEDATDKDWFKKIKAWFVQMLHRVGIDFGNIDEFGTPNRLREFTDNELRYLLWKSYRNLVADAESRTELARDAMMQSELGVGNYAPQTVAAESMAREENDDDFDPDDNGGGVMFRDAEPANKIAGEYNRMTGANVDGVNDVKRGWEQFARGQLDDMRPLEQMQQLIQKALGRELRDSERAYELATQLVSKTGRQIDRENLDYMVPMLQQVTSAMRSLMEAEGLSREEAYKRVNNYLLAKHGLERNEWFMKQGKKEGDYAGLRGLAESLGENPDDYKAVAERIVNEFEQEVDTKDLWKFMKALTNRMLEISYESGMIDKDTYEDLKQRHNYYVPLRGFADGTASDLFDYVSQSPHYQNIMKTAKGRKSMADDPLGNLMNMLQSAIVIGNQNQVMQKIYNLAVNGKNDLLRISKPWYVYNDTTDTWEEKFPDIPEDATADEIDAIMKQFDADMQQLKAQGKAKQKRNRLEVGKKILPAEAREHRMIAYINGQKVAMHVAGNPLVAQAMNRRNTQHLGKVMQGIQTATRWYSSINTSWSPAFGPKNARRDIRFMLFSSFVEGGMKKQLSALGNILRATWVLPRLIVTGKMDSGITKMLRPQDAAQLEQWWNEFLDNGGETGFTRTLNAEKAKAEVKDMVRHMLNGSKDGENRVRKYTIGLLEWIGRYSEDISRFAAYCMQRANGGSVLGSIQEAKNVTVNFNVHGGSDLAANCRALYSFFNASMQGINRMRRLATEHPGRFIAGISALMLGGAVLPWINMAMFAMLGGDDDDWRKYEMLTEYTANHNMILYVGNHKFLSIPWSQELAPFNALGNIWFRQQMGWNKGKSVAEQWGDMFVDLSPVSVASGKKPGVGLVKTIMPSFTTPVWEAIFNEDFTGSPLYKDNQWNKYDAAWEKAYEGKTSKSVINASRWLDEKTGIDINPAIAEHLFSGVLGGMGRSGDKLLRYFTNGFQLQDAPFIRTMMFDSNPKGYIGAVQREYGRLAYDVLPKAKHDAEDMTATEYAAFTQTEEYDIANTVSIYKTGKDLAGNKTSFQGIDKMEKEYKRIAGMSDGSEEYREQLEELRLQITEDKMEMLDEIQQIKYEHGSEMRKRIIDRVKEVETESKEKYKRKHPDEE